MATKTNKRNALQLEYMGIEGKTGGTYTNNNIKGTASDEQIEMTGRAIGDLQSKTTKRIFKIASFDLED